MAMNWEQNNKCIKKLCDQGEKVIESEFFKGVHYVAKDNHIIVIAGQNGELSVKMDVLDEFVQELLDIREVWENDTAGKCPHKKQRH